MRRSLLLGGLGTAVIGLAAAVVGLHLLLAGSQDAWAASIQAVSTVALVAITGWYAFLTFRLVEAQRSTPRIAAWEGAVRDLSTFVARHHEVMWTAAVFFPVDTGKRPPMLNDVIASRDALRALRDNLLQRVGLLPKDLAGRTLGVAAHLLDAEAEFHALAGALLDETQLGLRENRSWTWGGAKAAHEAAQADPERQEDWDDVLRGRRFEAANDRWEQLAADVDKWLLA